MHTASTRTTTTHHRVNEDNEDVDPPVDVVVDIHRFPTIPSLVSEGVLAFLRCRNIYIYGVHKNVKFLRHL